MPSAKRHLMRKLPVMTGFEVWRSFGSVTVIPDFVEIF